jgi:hypothetical protein
MAQGIFLIQSDGSLVELSEQSYDSENLLQELLAKYPNVLSGNQPTSSERPRRWLLIKREMGIPDGENTNDRWSIDHLFLDEDGVPSLVEVKRSSDTRIRREVVGQMLDYAANAIVYWPTERIQAEIESEASRQGLDSDMLIQEFIGEDRNTADFWQKVKTNISTGKIRLVFVADKIPKELQRIVEFLNEQMSPAEVYAVEIKQYTGHGVKSLVPRVIGNTTDAEFRKSAGAILEKKLWDENSFLEVLAERKNKKEIETTKQIFAWAKDRNLRIAWGSGTSDGAFFAMLDLDDITHYTFAVRTGGKEAYIQLQFGQLRKPFDVLEYRQELAERIQKAG